MLNLKEIIHQLEEEEFNAVAFSLKASRADKFLKLLLYYRENTLTDDEILNQLNINTNAFYVLKSRLLEKIQDSLISNLADPETKVLRKVSTIPQIIYSAPRDVSTAILKKLEKDLLDYDMPYHLTSVYRALKKLHLNSEKYFHYTQLYNKHVAYTLALDKAEDLLANFVKEVGYYFLSRDTEHLKIFTLIRDEMANVCRLYESHHLQVYRNILDVSIAIFLPLPDLVQDDDPIEDILERTEKILDQYPKDVNYQHIRVIKYYLYFEYYHKLRLQKKEKQYFELVNEHIPQFLYYGSFCFYSRFLMSKVERYLTLGIEDQLYEENEKWIGQFKVPKEDVPNYINFAKYFAVSAFYTKRYDEANRILVDLLNEVSFKQFAHAEVEVKLFLVLTYSMSDKYDLAWNVLRSCTRKIRELNKKYDYENGVIFAKLLRTQLGTNNGKQVDKALYLRSKFEILNQGKTRMLEFIKLDDSFVGRLVQPIKT